MATFSVLVVPQPSGVPFIDRVEADDLPIVGDLIQIQGDDAQITHVWPGEDAELRAIARPRLTPTG